MNLEKKDYNYGVDILKILATAMIIIMHILLQGGVIRGSVPGTANYYLSWILEGICFGGVNLYALGTGFLNAKKNIKISSFIKRWFQVFFYVAFFTLLFRLLMPGVVSLKSWVEVFVPILSNQYWYFTQYFVLFLLMPFLNKLMASLNEREFKKLVCVIILVFSFIPTIRQYDIFYTANGYSALWLMAMYLVGGYFAYYKDNVKISTQFKHLVQVHRITDMDVFEIAKNHAGKLGYPCEEGSENNLRRRMQEVESGNLDRVLKIVDNAVSKAHNREMTTGEQEHRLVSSDFE